MESVDPTQLDQLSETDDEREGVELQTIGIPFDYTVPHFPVITCKLRQIPLGLNFQMVELVPTTDLSEMMLVWVLTPVLH